MARKTRSTATPASSAAPSPQVLRCQEVREESSNVTKAKFATAPEIAAALTSYEFNRFNNELDVHCLVGEMRRQTKLVNDGDLSRVEAMLIAQAHSLDAMFNEFARRARLNMGEYLEATETYMRMALKAQSQCRATLQTLGEIKIPRSIAFIRQANLANGPQQVNNEVALTSRAPEKTPNSTNELLETDNGEWLDAGATSQAGRGDKALEAVGAINGAENRRG